MSDDNEIDSLIAEYATDDAGSTQNNESVEADERPMSSPQAQAVQEYEYKARGQTIKEPIDKILQRASQGYDYAQSMSEFNRQKLEHEKMYGPYREIDDYAKQNPDWFNHVRSAYQDRGNFRPQAGAQTPVDGNVDPHIQAINEKLSRLEKQEQDRELTKQASERESQDKKYLEELESIRKSHKNLDFDSPDVNGKSLELQVLEHARDNNISSFKTAFRDFYHEKLLDRAREEGKELAAKEVAKRSKLGLLGEHSAPKEKGLSPPKSGGKQYEDVDDILKEMGLNTRSQRI